jgi:ubiquinone/menaquinone biosynthesis C-methylase UbiE
MDMGDNTDPREFFGRHHHDYVVSPRHARGKDLERLIDGVGPGPGDAALDVATGGGHTAIRLAKAGAAVTVVDITREMLADAVDLAHEQGFVLTPVEGPAEQLPFSDGEFDIVTCRRAAHHFRDVEQFLCEAYRVLKPQGRLGISDMTASLAQVQWLNTLEKHRDPSHFRALAPDEWYDAVAAAGFRDIVVQLWEEPMAFEEWLSPVKPDTSFGQAALSFLSQVDAPRELVRGTMFIKRRLLLWAVR